MKKLLRYANLLALGCGGLGMLLMLWVRANGPDGRGLYPARHPAWTLLLLLTLALPVVFWLISRSAGTNNTYRFNFPVSLLAAAGYALAGVCLAVTGFASLDSGETLGILAGFAGILGGILLLTGTYTRCIGRGVAISPHGVACVFFTLELFYMGQTLGAEPEMVRYLFPFLAMLSAIPATYWLWSFDVEMGNRCKCLFWCLAAGYCNLVAAIGSENRLLHLGIALWTLTALPRLQLPRRPQAAGPQKDDDPLPTPPAVENVVAEVESHKPPLADVDAIMEQILNDSAQ